MRPCPKIHREILELHETGPANQAASDNGGMRGGGRSGTLGPPCLSSGVRPIADQQNRGMFPVQLDIKTAEIYTCVFAPDGTAALIGSQGNPVALWDLRNGARQGSGADPRVWAARSFDAIWG